MITQEFHKLLIHNMLRRAEWHDYYEKCFYLITLMKNPSSEVPSFSSLKNNNGKISIDFSWAGWGIYNGIQEFKKKDIPISVWLFVIMPDHVHIILSADERLDKHFGRYVSDLKTLCTQKFQSKSKIHGFTSDSVFGEGFNDRVLLHKNQLKNWGDYIMDNPRRLWLMHSNPDFFTKTSFAKSENLPAELWAPNQTPMLQLYGNRLLLEYPELLAVRFSRSFTSEEWQKKKIEALRVAKNGGVLVSPFIHKEEKAILEEGLLLGTKVIKVIADGFLDRAKPQGADFDHCVEGRMLLAAMNGGVYTPTPISRDLCLHMNALALWISENPEKLIR